jgi:transposase-like protein
MDANLLQAIFTDETTAREWLESQLWPDGPVCPHCGSDRDRITGLRGKAHRPGLYQCNACREQFTITVKTVFEKSRIPLSKWLTALFLMTASKKRISGHQVHRILGVSYKSTWFMCHRLREAMRPAKYPPLGGLEETVEVDETYIGGKSGEPQKPPSSRQAGHSRVGPSRRRWAFVPDQESELKPNERDPAFSVPLR